MKNRFAVSLRRAIGLVVLSAFGLMVLGASPVFAWHLQGCDVATPCAGFTTHINPSTIVVAGTALTDTANLIGCDGSHACGSASGSITGSIVWKAYTGGTCAGTVVSHWPGSAASDTKAGPFGNPATVVSDSFSTTGLVGAYSFQATFVGTGSWAFTTVGPCEPFNVTAAPPHSVPEFPLGLPALLLLALPAMILLRRRLPHA